MTVSDDAAGPPRMLMILSRVFLWVIWAAILTGGLSFALIEAVILRQGTPPPVPPDPRNLALLFTLNVGGGLTVIAIAHIARFFLLRSAFSRKSPVVLLVFYYLGKLLCWFVCNGTLFFSLVLILIARSFHPYIWYSVLIWLLLIADAPWFLPFRKYSLPARVPPPAP